MRAGGEGAVDILIVGGGVNGAGIARDAAGRGLSVLLCEQNDLGSGTSSASTKLIHGGLRYLEHYEFRLVREALIEREVLLRAAPHIVRPLRFVLPHNGSMRPAWLVRLGLFLYDHLGGRELLPGSRSVDLRSEPAGAALQPQFAKAFEYSDCWVEDARLVVLTAMDAQERGADIRTRTRCVAARRDGDLWRVRLAPAEGGEEREVTARALVNAAGPWVADVLNARIGLNARGSVRLIKGSHIVVPRLFEGDQAYIFQNDDRRIVFAIPYEGDYTLIGTTDVDYDGDPAAVAIAEDEVAYLCRAVSGYFKQTVTSDRIVWTYSGVRPLYDDKSKDASAVTRDYVLELDAPEDAAPLLSVFGGKITTFRRLAEQAVDRLAAPLGVSAGPWTADAPLPGGDIPSADFEAFLAGLRRDRPWLPELLARRYARAYGTRTDDLLGDAGSLDQLGEDFGDGLHEAELRYVVAREFVTVPEDFFWRRSKMGLHAGEKARSAVAAWFAGQGEAAGAGRPAVAAKGKRA